MEQFGETDQPPLLMGRTVEMIEEKGGKAPLLCAHILSNCLCLEYDGMDDVRQQLSFALLGKDIKPWDDPLFAAKKLEEHSGDISTDKREKVRALLEKDILKGIFREDCYGILPYLDQTILNIGAEDIFRSPEYETLSAGYSALKAVQAGIPKTLAKLPLMRVWSQACVFDEGSTEDYRNEILILELEILENPRLFIPHIQRFQEEFNPFYQFAADFLDMVVQSGYNKIQNETNRRIPRAMKLNTRLILRWLGEDDDVDVDDISMPEERKEPVRVTKVGRNEPCPCGSGKKYKKCCGQ